ncbi:MAG: IMP dehydrogenase [Patescibacteria group bacterium]|nr:IMP dehydrogenase [Patescibacteria group bacterium]
MSQIYPTFPIALSFDDVLLVPQKSTIVSRAEIDLSTQIAPNIKLSVPLISMSMDTVTGVEMAIAIARFGGIGFLPRFDLPEIEADKVKKVKKAGQKVVAAIGLRDDYLKRAEMQVKAGADGITLDIAHAHTTTALEAVSRFKNKFPKIPMIAGTIATYEGAEDLFKAGADTVRVGVGAGTICTTRIVAGSGVPQITAILEANRARKRFKNKYVLGDGGAAKSGDIIKGLACGADAYMSGSLFAGTDEAPGEIITRNGVFYKEYDASTSSSAKKAQVKKDGNGRKPHFNLHVEGVESLVKYKGPVSDVLEQLCAGIRSGLSYSGAHNIKELQKKANFVRITAAGLRESYPHDVEVV